MVEILYGLEGIQKGIADYHSSPQKNFYMAGSGAADVYFNCDYLAIPPVGQEYNFPPNWWWMTKTLPDGRIGWIFMQVGARQYRFKTQPGATIETASYYWESSAGYNIASPPWWPAFDPFYNAGSFSVIPEQPWLHKHNYNSVDIIPFVNLWLSCVSADLATRALPYWTTARWGEPWTTYEVVADIEIFYRSESHLDGYYFDFPSWAPLPDWYHFATLIKADGTSYGKEIAVTREAPSLPFNMEVWRKEPDPSEIYEYFPKQFLMDSNLLDELEFPLEPSAELAEIGGGDVTPILFYPWLSEPPTDQQFTPAQLAALTTDPTTGELIFDPDTDNGDIMPDSLLMKKIGAAVEADRYGVHPTNPDAPNLNNLGRLIEAIGYLLGINLDPDGINIPYPDPEYLTPEQVKEISHLKTSQFAAFDGAKGMQVASLYDIRANVPVKDSFGKTVIQPGGAVKVWNLAQFLDQAADDTEAQLGGAALASLQVPAGDGKSYIQYEGLGHAIQDLVFMASVQSQRVDELVIQAARTIHLAQQILMGLGLPMRPDTIDFLVGAETATAENPPKQAVAPVASLDPSGPTLASLAGIILANLSRLVAGSIGYQTTEISAVANTDTDDPFNFEEPPTPGTSDI